MTNTSIYSQMLAEAEEDLSKKLAAEEVRRRASYNSSASVMYFRFFENETDRVRWLRSMVECERSGTWRHNAW